MSVTVMLNKTALSSQLGDHEPEASDLHILSHN